MRNSRLLPFTGYSSILLAIGASLVGCQSTMTPRSGSTAAAPRAFASHSSHTSQAPIFPMSNMKTSATTNDVVTAAYQQPTRCTGPCCSPASYTPSFPEFATAYSAQPQNCGPTFGMMGCGPVGPSGANCYNCGPCPPALPRMIDPNEYVYDGGDRDPEARLRQDLSIVGVDSEDTVIRYETEAGTHEVQAGCRVPIYAPRFGSVRKISTLGYQDHVVATQAALRQERPSRMDDVLPPNAVRGKDQPVRDEAVKVVEAMQDRQPGILVDKVLPVIDISQAFAPHEDLAIIRHGELVASEMPKVQRFVMAAMAWTAVENLAVIVDNKAALLIQESSRAEEMLVYELDGKPRIRLCKVASHQVAEAGDIIDFTIRFDNVGDQKVSNIAVHDSLSPRLEYVEGSQKCNLEADFEAIPNDVGSSELRWTIPSEVKPGEGGLIRFQCKVR